MAYDEALAARVRAILHGDNVVEKKMFGGLCFMVDDKMTVGVLKDQLMARIGEAAMVDAIERDHVGPMDFTGKPMKNMVYIYPPGLQSEEQLAEWIQRASDYVATVKKKVRKKKAKPRK